MAMRNAAVIMNEMSQFPEIAAETDPQKRSRRWRELSPEGQASFRAYLATNYDITATPRKSPAFGTPEWFLSMAGTPEAPRFVEFTPEIAAAFLKNFRGNRRIKDQRIVGLVKSIKAGLWVPELSFFSVNEQGHPNNGAHRATAIIKAGVPLRVKLLVLPDDVVASTDHEVTPRGLADAIRMQNLPISSAANLNTAVAMVNLWHRIENGRVGSEAHFLNTAEVLATLEKYPVILEVASRKFHFASEPFRVAAYLVVVAMGMHYNREFAELFAEGVKEGVGLRSGDPRLVLRNRWLNKTAKDRQEMRVAIAIKAWNAFIEGRVIGVLKFMDTEEFPEFIRGTE